MFRLSEHSETTKAVETQQLRRRHPRGLREPFASGQVVNPSANPYAPFRDLGKNHISTIFPLEYYTFNCSHLERCSPAKQRLPTRARLESGRAGKSRVYRRCKARRSTQQVRVHAQASSTVPASRSSSPKLKLAKTFWAQPSCLGPTTSCFAQVKAA